MWTREQIAARAAEELTPGSYVNLGIGLPTLVANFIRPNQRITLQSENGLLGVGPYPARGTADADWINAGKETITANAGASTFDSATSFAMIRSGRIDVALLGAMEVAANGDLANWMVPGKRVKGMGGAMDLVAGVRRVVILMEHCTHAGESKLLKRCTLPLTGQSVVDRVITDLGVFDIEDDAFVLRELAAGTTLERVREATAGTLRISPSFH